MAAYIRKGSSRYWVTIRRRDGSYAHLSTGTRDRATARAMERMLQVLGGTGRRSWDLLDAVPTRCTLARLFDHYVGETLEVLRAELADVDLAPSVERWRATIAQRHRGESVRKYPRWSEALFPLDAHGRVQRAMRSRVTAPAYLARVLEDLPGGATTRRRHHEVFTAIFAYLLELQLLDENPMARVRKAEPAKKEQPHIARMADVLRLVQAMPDARTRAMAALAEGGGLEWDAIRAMRPIDVVNVAERVVFAHGAKNVYRDRQAVIDAEFWPTFHAYVDAAGALPLARLFDMPETRWRRIFRETCAALRKQHVPIPPRYAPHKARHTYTIRHLQAGDDITLIAENLGHADTSTLLRDYAKYRPKATEIRRAARDQEARRG